jgi:hypothetical protein
VRQNMRCACSFRQNNNNQSIHRKNNRQSHGKIFFSSCKPFPSMLYLTMMAWRPGFVRRKRVASAVWGKQRWWLGIFFGAATTEGEENNGSGSCR